MSLGFPLQDNVVIWLYDALQARYMALTSVVNLRIDHTFQGVEELSFEIPALDPRAQYLIPDQLIEYPEGRFWINSNYRDRNPRPTRTVKATARWTQLTWIQKPGVLSIIGKSPTDGMTQILTGSGWTKGTVMTSPEIYTYEDIDATILELLRAWASVVGGELVFHTDTKVVDLVPSSGVVKDVGFFYGSNLHEIEREFQPPQVTRMYPYGANDLTITAVNPDGVPYIEDYSWYMDMYGLTETQARNLYRKDFSWKDDRFFTAVALYDAAMVYLPELAKPQISYKGKILDLSRITGVTSDDANPGDWVTVADEILNYAATTRVTRMVRYPLEPNKDEIELELFNTGLLDVENSEREINYDQIQVIADTNEEDLTIGGTGISYNQIAITSTGQATVIGSGHFVGVATGTGTIEFVFSIDGVDYGEPVQKAFTNGQQIEHSWVTFADALDEGPHVVQWTAQVVSGAGTVLLEAEKGRGVIWMAGGLGLGTDASPNQFLIENLPEFTTMLTFISWSDDFTVDHHADVEVLLTPEGDGGMEETLAEYDDTDLPADFVEWEAEFAEERAYAFGVYWLDNTEEHYEELADEISAIIPSSCLTDDLIVVFLWHRTGAENITAPSGYTRIAQEYVDDGTFEQWAEVWTRTAPDDFQDGVELTFEGTILDRMGIMIALIRNAEGGTVAVDALETDTYIATFTDPGEEKLPDVIVTDPYRLGVFYVSCVYAPGPPELITYGVAFYAPEALALPVISTDDPDNYDGVLSVTDGTWQGSDEIYTYQWFYVADHEPLPGVSTEATYTPLAIYELELAGSEVGCEVTTQNVHGETSVDSSNTLVIPLPRRATGGTITDDGDLVYHTFSADGELGLIEPFASLGYTLPVTWVITGTGSYNGVSTDGSDDLGDTPATILVTSGTVVVAYDPFTLAEPPFEPMDITWDNLYWVEGPKFLALALADGAEVATWPDETADDKSATQASSTTRPLYRASHAEINNKPHVHFVSADFLSQATSSVTRSSYSIVTIMYWPTNTGRFQDVGSGGRAIIGHFSGNHQLFFGGTASQSVAATAPQLRGQVNIKSASNDRLRVNGSVIYSGVNTGTSTMRGGYSFGNSGDTAMNGARVAFVGYYNGDITADPLWADFQAWVLDEYGVSI